MVIQVEGWPTEGMKVVRWEEIGRLANIRDFDDIVLDVSEVPQKPVGSFDRFDEEAIEVWKPFTKTFASEVVREFLEQPGRLLIAGDANFHVPASMGYMGDWGSARTTFTSFLGLDMEWESAVGTRIEVAEAARQRGVGGYLERLGQYTAALTKAHPYVPLGPYGEPIGKPETPQGEVLAATRSGKPIAFSLRWPSPKGEVSFLPLPRTGRGDALRTMLREYFGVDLVDAAPAWASDLRAPEEDEIDERARSLRNRIEALDAELRGLEGEREGPRRALRLLHAMDDELEEAVREALAELGAAVEPPTDPSKEDGWLSVQAGGRRFDGVLEIKGTEKEHFGAKGLRQLGEWVQRGENQRGTRYKPIFVGASLVRRPPAERPNPFVDDVRKTAVQFGAALLRAEDLYRAVAAHRRARLDADAFWKAVFDTVGPVEVEHLLAGRDT